MDTEVIAIAGIVGTLAGTGLGGFFAWKVERARWEREDKQWWRRDRREVYSAFIAAADKFHMQALTAAGEWEAAQERLEEDTQQERRRDMFDVLNRLVDELTDSWHSLVQARAEVRLLGTNQAREAAHHLAGTLALDALGVLRLEEPFDHAAWDDYLTKQSTTMDGFLRVARNDLEVPDDE